MKSFKNKILQKAKIIKAQKANTNEINAIVDRIDTGDIYMPKGNDKYSFAEAIADQNSKNINSNPNEVIISKGDYNTLTRIDKEQNSNIPSRNIPRKFGAENDYIEAHIYNSSGQLLQSINGFEDYKAPTNEDSYGKINNFTVNPVEILTGLYYTSGQYKLILNLQKRQILDGFAKKFTVKGIIP